VLNINSFDVSVTGNPSNFRWMKLLLWFVFVFVFVIHVLYDACLHRMTYSPLYANNQAVWPNMSRPRLRSQCGETCGDLLVSTSSRITTESSAHDIHAHTGITFGICYTLNVALIVLIYKAPVVCVLVPITWYRTLKHYAHLLCSGQKARLADPQLAPCQLVLRAAVIDSHTSIFTQLSNC